MSRCMHDPATDTPDPDLLVVTEQMIKLAPVRPEITRKIENFRKGFLYRSDSLTDSYFRAELFAQVHRGA